MNIIVYTGIAKWIADNKLSLKEFTEKVGVSSTNHLSAILRGEYNTSKTMIDKILAATGLTYEEAFGTVKDDANV